MILPHSSTSNLVRFVLKRSDTGMGFTDLTNTSASLNIHTITNNEASPTRYLSDDSNIETVATIGTYAAPSANKCRFRQVNATYLPGLYEFQFADARFAVASAKTLIVSVNNPNSNATLLDTDYEIQLVSWLAA